MFMNKKLLLAIAICLTTASFATIRKVLVADNVFTPSYFRIHPGDTILWVWSNGAHTTTSGNIPAGAASWNSNIDATTSSYMYVPTVTGVYHYQCSFSVSAGMTGSFTVTRATGIASESKTPLFTAYPNPVGTTLHIQLRNATRPVAISFTDMGGNDLIEQDLDPTPSTDLDLTNIPNGTYYLHAEQNDKTTSEQITVQH